MAEKPLSANCPSCSFPIYGHPGEILDCPNCGITGKISAVGIPDPIFWGGLGLIAGIIICKSKIIGKKLATL